MGLGPAHTPRDPPCRDGGQRRRHPGERRGPVREGRRDSTAVNTEPWASQSRTCSPGDRPATQFVFLGSGGPHPRAARATRQEALVFSPRAPEDTSGLMVTVTQAEPQAEARDQRVNNLLKTTLKGQGRPGPAQGSTAQCQQPACRQPCPAETQAHRGGLTSLHLPGTLDGWPGRGLLVSPG